MDNKEKFEKPVIEVITLSDDDFIVTFNASEGIWFPEYPEED